MGTTASAAPPTAPESFNSNGMMDSRQSLSSASFQAVNIHNSKAKSIITNKVAPVVITYNCRQEFQIHDDLPRTHYKMGRIADNMPDHFLVQGSYFMVQDVFSEADVLNTTRSCGAPNFRQCKGSYPVFSMGQPSLAGFKRVLETLQNQGSEEVIFFCVREEPVLFLRLEDDFVPYTPRSAEKLREQLQGLSKEVSVENLELSIRREIHDFARLNESVFYVYNDIENFKDEPHKISISSEEDIHVTEEVYKRPLFTIPAYRYHRLPLPLVGAPREEQFDAFISMLRENSCLSLNRDSSRPLPALLFGCQAGKGRADMGMVLGTLVLQHLVGAPPPPPQSPPPVSPTEPGVTEAVDSEQKVQFQVIQMLIDKLPKGQQVMQEVDRAIELCSEVHIKEAIYDNKRKLEAIGEDDQTQGSCSKAHLLQRALQDLERYIYLILFNAYLHEQYPLAFARNFSQWMCANAWVYRLLACMNQSELKAPADLVTKGTRVLVSDEYMAPDVLSTMKEMKVANFRRVPKMPVYGMAQPTAEALSVVLAYLRAERRLHKQVLWVSLQAELVLEADGRMFSPREACCLNQPILLHAANTHDIQSLETALKEELLRAQKSLDVMLEREKQTKLFKSYHTLLEIFTQQQSLLPGLHYHRIPLPEHGAPREMDFDRLLEVMKSVLAEDPRAALVFSCATGRASTTTAMTSAVLTCWHFSGFPEGGEEEIVSVPDAKYTKGEFEVVMQLVRLLPDGHRMKREVDMALDCVSETMTPMHYHLREIIISTYRQIKSSKTDQERHSLSLRSLRYLERYIYLILFNTYLHLEKRSCWTRPFSTWMQEVAARAGVYDLLNQLGFWEFENQKDSPLARLRARWQEQSRTSVPFRGELI